jgi:hypothetical protein
MSVPAIECRTALPVPQGGIVDMANAKHLPQLGNQRCAKLDLKPLQVHRNINIFLIL